MIASIRNRCVRSDKYDFSRSRYDLRPFPTMEIISLYTLTQQYPYCDHICMQIEKLSIRSLSTMCLRIQENHPFLSND